MQYVALAAALLLVPAFAATSAAASEEGPVRCLLGPHIPETNVYYIVWYCATNGEFGEPIEDTTGCVIGFPITDIRCNGSSLPGIIINPDGLPPCGVRPC